MELLSNQVEEGNFDSILLVVMCCDRSIIHIFVASVNGWMNE
jgi:hypothetical protein